MTAPGLTTQLRAAMPFTERLGLTLVDARPEKVSGRAEWRADLCTAGSMLHGGVLMALADSCGAFCAYLNLPDASSTTTTVSSSTSFLRGVREGHVHVHSRPLHVGRRMITVETELRDDSDRLVAQVSQAQVVIASR